MLDVEDQLQYLYHGINLWQLRGRLLDVYPGKRLPMSFTLLIEHDEDQNTYPVRDMARS